MKKHRLFTAAMMAAVFVSSPWSRAQVPVVESSNRVIGAEQRSAASVPSTFPAATISNSTSSGAGNGNGAAEVFYQLQMLQQEVSALRGLVEEQAYELKRLKQQRLDDYLSLDKRLSAVMGGAPGTAVTTDPALDAPPVTSGYQALSQSQQASSVTSAASADEAGQYRAAIDLILKQKDYVQADSALNQYLVAYPRGQFAANSQYWLGELALLNGDLDKARQWFSRMVTEWPDHGKVADASYKLGTVYHKLGDAGKARSLLQAVASGNSNAARLAKSYLDTHLN